MESLQHFKRPWAHEHEPVTTLLDAVKVHTPYPSLWWCLHICVHMGSYWGAVARIWTSQSLSCAIRLVFLQAIKPTVLIGSSGAGRTFTKEVVEAMTSLNEARQLWYNFLFFIFFEKSYDSAKIIFLAFRNLSFLLSRTQLRSLNVRLKKLTHGARWSFTSRKLVLISYNFLFLLMIVFSVFTHHLGQSHFR